MHRFIFPIGLDTPYQNAWKILQTIGRPRRLFVPRAILDTYQFGVDIVLENEACTTRDICDG